MAPSTWWTSYADPQLNALIAEALAGAPSLAQAEARLRQAEAIAQQVGASASRRSPPTRPSPA